MKKMFLTLSFVLVLAAFVILIQGAADNNKHSITVFQGDIGHSGYISTNPVRSRGKVKWKFKTDEFVFTSPVVKDSIAYFGSDDDCLYAIRVNNGSLLWKFKTSGDIRATPCITEEYAYLPSEDGNLYKLDLKNGGQIWKFSCGEMLMKNRITAFSIASSPIVYDNLVYYGSYDGTMYALDTNTGETVWRFTTDASIKSSPAFYNGNIYFASLNGKLYCVNGKSGKLKWYCSSRPSCNNPAGQFISSPMIHDGIVYIGGLEFHMFALDAETGQEKWVAYLGDQPVFSTPAIYNESIYFGTQGWHNPRVYSMDTKGNKRWMFERTDKKITDTSGNLSIGSWRFDDQIFTASPVIAGDILYIGSWDGCLYALNPVSGKELWQFKTGGPIAGSAAVHDGVVLVGSYDGFLYALSE